MVVVFFEEGVSSLISNNKNTILRKTDKSTVLKELNAIKYLYGKKLKGHNIIFWKKGYIALSVLHNMNRTRGTDIDFKKKKNIYIFAFIILSFPRKYYVFSVYFNLKDFSLKSLSVKHLCNFISEWMRIFTSFIFYFKPPLELSKILHTITLNSGHPHLRQNNIVKTICYKNKFVFVRNYQCLSDLKIVDIRITIKKI